MSNLNPPVEDPPVEEGRPRSGRSPQWGRNNATSAHETSSGACVVALPHVPVGPGDKTHPFLLAAIEKGRGQLRTDEAMHLPKKGKTPRSQLLPEKTKATCDSPFARWNQHYSSHSPQSLRRTP